MPQAAFTSEQFMELAKQSPSVQQMAPEKMQAVMDLAATPDSPKTQRIYELLLEEKTRLQYVESQFNSIVNKAMDKFETGIIDEKGKFQKQKMQRLQGSASMEEEKEAEALLQSLH